MAKLIESFFWGFLAAIGALIIEIVFYIIISPFVYRTGSMTFSQFFIAPQFIIIAACIEEILKGIFIFRRFNVLPPEKSRFLNAFFLGLGFYLLELVLILITRVSPDPQFLAEIAIVHISTTCLIGQVIDIKNIKKSMLFIGALAVATLLHAGYNLLILSRTDAKYYFIFIILCLLVLSNIFLFIRAKLLSRKIIGTQKPSSLAQEQKS